MNLLTSAPEWMVWFLIALLCAAAAQDIAQMKMSNWTTASIAILGVCSAVAVGPEVGLWQNFAASAAVMFLGFVLFAKGWMGGGDVKLLAATALWVNLTTALWLIAAVLICGGLLTVIVLFARMIVPARIGIVGPLRNGAGIPYGVAIACGAIATMLALRS